MDSPILYLSLGMALALSPDIGTSRDGLGKRIVKDFTPEKFTMSQNYRRFFWLEVGSCSSGIDGNFTVLEYPVLELSCRRWMGCADGH